MLRASYGRKSRKICNEGGNKPISNLHCESKKSFDFVDDQCSDRQSCSIAATNTIFGDPCRGTSKYLDVEYKCIERPTYRPRQSKYCEILDPIISIIFLLFKSIIVTSIEKKMACESTDLSISCPRGNEITILRANYGRLSRTICDQDGKAPISDVRCGRSKKSKDIVSGQCDGKQRCNVSANNVVFGDPCFGTYKYLEVSYVCTKDINAGNDDNDDNDRIDDSDLNNDNDDNDRLVILIS